MSDPQSPPQYPAFDLNAMMYAMPNRGIVPRDQMCYAHLVPNEVLGEIFEWLKYLPPSSGVTKPPPEQPYSPPRPYHPAVLVSHVCRRWRRVVVNMVKMWTNLAMYSTRHPEVLSELISRSKQFPFLLVIRLPSLDIERCPDERQIEFRETFKVLKRSLTRLHSLNITTNNATFCLIFNKFLKNDFFLGLETLILTQIDETARRYNVGPVIFNPTIFHTLVLKNITIECDASCLAGLRSLDLVNCAGTLLDQTQLSHSTYPVIPGTPIMNQLAMLKVDGTHLLPTSANLTPSFTSTSLRTLVLTRISMPIQAALEPVDRLFRITYTPHLEALFLDSLDINAFTLFVRRLASPVPKYSRVQKLTLVRVEGAAIDLNFMKAFPGVVNLFLVAVNPAPVMAFLEDSTLMPLLKYVVANGSIFQRTIKAVVPPADGATPAL